MKLARQLSEDRAMRDAALSIFKSDIEFIRNDLRRRGIGERVADRLGEGAADMMDDAIDYADDNRGKIGAMVLAAVMWFARGPILGIFTEDEEAAGETGEPKDAADHSEED